MIIESYIGAVGLLIFSGLPALMAGRRSNCGEKLSAALLTAGSLLGIFAAGASIVAPPPELLAPWPVPGGKILLRLDGLAVVFLLPAFLVSGLGSIYGLGYWPRSRHGKSADRLRLFYGILAGALVLLPSIHNGVLFLMAWEVMALAGFFLILTEQEKEEVRRAAYVYLAATHTGTLALFALFCLLARITGSFDFPAAGLLNGWTPTAPILFLLALFGFGIKAGIMPLHIWLPEAHAAAPSHVSALMSGVMIKMGIYGIIRICSFFFNIPAWWGWTILILGAVSGVVGVAFAIAQHDIKRLLAYHSVENIGIILLGLGTALLGQSFGAPSLAALGLAGALLHVVNHGLFKSLLFLSAGAVINATGTRHIDRYGGLLRKMSATGFFFLGGAVAICGLPPLNGFVSEWLIYLGSLQSQSFVAPISLTLTAIVAPVLAMIGALAVACFVKVFGVTFLGEPRTVWPTSISEPPAGMLLPMAVLLFFCLLIGVVPSAALPFLLRALSDWGVSASGSTFATILAPIGSISLGAVLLLSFIAAITFWQKKAGRESDSRPSTWGCGYLKGTARMQYTASSFAEMLTNLFRWVLWSDVKGGRAIGFYPGLAKMATHTPDVVLDRIIHPAFRAASRMAFRIRAFLQHGVIGIYLLYTALALFFFLFLVLKFPS